MVDVIVYEGGRRGGLSKDDNDSVMSEIAAVSVVRRLALSSGRSVSRWDVAKTGQGRITGR